MVQLLPRTQMCTYRHEGAEAAFLSCSTCGTLRQVTDVGLDE